MRIHSLPLGGLLLIETKVFRDARGYFFESHNESALRGAGLDVRFVQDNVSFSVKGVVRGLHYQKEPHAQGKLVRALQGTVFDVAVDLRRDSPTYGKWHAETLTEGDGKALYIPPGFAHGFCATSDTALFHYKCTAPYHPDSDAGLLWNDPELAIAWPPEANSALVSEKDQRLPSLKKVNSAV